MPQNRRGLRKRAKAPDVHDFRAKNALLPFDNPHYGLLNLTLARLKAAATQHENSVILAQFSCPLAIFL
jgi:hypothetical protein